MKYRAAKAFTLAELLISLAILGVIATFAIPKVLSSQQDGKYNAIGKEIAGALSQAYQQRKLEGLLTVNDDSRDLVGNYFNYVKRVTDGSVLMDGGRQKKGDGP